MKPLVLYENINALHILVEEELKLTILQFVIPQKKLLLLLLLLHIVNGCLYSHVYKKMWFLKVNEQDNVSQNYRKC